LIPRTGPWSRGLVQRGRSRRCHTHRRPGDHGWTPASTPSAPRFMSPPTISCPASRPTPAARLMTPRWSPSPSPRGHGHSFEPTLPGRRPGAPGPPVSAAAQPARLRQAPAGPAREHRLAGRRVCGSQPERRQARAPVPGRRADATRGPGRHHRLRSSGCREPSTAPGRAGRRLFLEQYAPRLASGAKLGSTAVRARARVTRCRLILAARSAPVVERPADGDAVGTDRELPDLGHIPGRAGLQDGDGAADVLAVAPVLQQQHVVGEVRNAVVGEA